LWSGKVWPQSLLAGFKDFLFNITLVQPLVNLSLFMRLVKGNLLSRLAAEVMAGSCQPQRETEGRKSFYKPILNFTPPVGIVMK